MNVGLLRVCSALACVLILQFTFTLQSYESESALYSAGVCCSCRGVLFYVNICVCDCVGDNLFVELYAYAAILYSMCSA